MVYFAQLTKMKVEYNRPTTITRTSIAAMEIFSMNTLIGKEISLKRSLLVKEIVRYAIPQLLKLLGTGFCYPRS